VTFVKICGITDREAAQAAVAAGADAVGFVFAASPRQVSPETAKGLAADVPRSTLRVAVFHHPTRQHFAHVIAVFAPDWVQTDAEDLVSLPVPDTTYALPVFRNGRVPDRANLPERLLFEGARSGTGVAADWAEARALAATTQVVLAGGLSAANVEAAIKSIRPWGVDVSTGVEHALGRKDPDKIRAFVARVRALENRA
jgi:phosphoribosylanthranilate isomerase